MNGRADILSRKIDVIERWHEQKRPLLCLVALQTDDPIWIENCILEYFKVALKEGITLKPILDFLGNSKQGPSAIFKNIFFMMAFFDFEY